MHKVNSFRLFQCIREVGLCPNLTVSSIHECEVWQARWLGWCRIAQRREVCPMHARGTLRGSLQGKREFCERRELRPVSPHRLLGGPRSPVWLPGVLQRSLPRGQGVPMWSQDAPQHAQQSNVPEGGARILWRRWAVRLWVPGWEPAHQTPGAYNDFIASSSFRLLICMLRRLRCCGNRFHPVNNSPSHRANSSCRIPKFRIQIKDYGCWYFEREVRAAVVLCTWHAALFQSTCRVQQCLMIEHSRFHWTYVVGLWMRLCATCSLAKSDLLVRALNALFLEVSKYKLHLQLLVCRQKP